MKKNLLFAALAAAALTSCSYDEVIEVQKDEMTFTVITDNQTKAADVYCQNNLMEVFNVFATYTKDSKTSWYIKNDIIELDNGQWVDKTATRYWSPDGTHDFVAFTNAGTIEALDDQPTTAIKAVNFTPKTDVTEQVDFVYAVNKGLNKEDGNVALNFRHALSQIEFWAKNTNDQLYVVIKDIKVGNTPSKGDFTFPTESTTTAFVNHNQNTTATLNVGTWELSDLVNSYEVDLGEGIFLSRTANHKGLTTSIDVSGNSTRNFTNSLLLLPTSSLTNGKTVAWDPETEIISENAGTYLAINCDIYNVAGSVFDATTDVKVHTGWTYIPVSFSWEPGKKYIYTFVFGQGEGGYTPGGDPTLAPITYSVTVDDFQLGTNSDVELN